ncbi:MAG: hypothetical protein JWM34_1974 [Ilumatobacteraceae bacterium]|nr:hypothetical protein [Ilumatobacteraceae bacterium]
MEVDVVHRVAARVGLVGNPSDGFGGAVLGTIVPGLSASVTARAADGIVIAGPDMSERWSSLREWLDGIAPHDSHGSDGGQRIISASLWTLVEHLRWMRPEAPERGAAVSWRTDIPISVGLAGSSALAVGTIGAVAECWGITLDPRVCAALALSAERDVLGIAAGWQDRIVQAFGCTVLVDALTMGDVDGVAVPAVHAVAAPVGGSTRVRLVVGWHAGSGSSSDDYHAPLQRDPGSLALPMTELAALARAATVSLEHGDVDAFAAAVDEGWRIRQACVPLRPDHTAIVECVRAAGVAATTPGSGGSVVAVCHDAGEVDRVRDVLRSAGCEAVDVGIT